MKQLAGRKRERERREEKREDGHQLAKLSLSLSYGVCLNSPPNPTLSLTWLLPFLVFLEQPGSKQARKEGRKERETDRQTVSEGGRTTRERVRGLGAPKQSLTACCVDLVTALRTLILGCEGASEGDVGGDVMMFVVLGCGQRWHHVGEKD